MPPARAQDKSEEGAIVHPAFVLWHADASNANATRIREKTRPVGLRDLSHGSTEARIRSTADVVNGPAFSLHEPE
ncbi:hypothetical protein BKA93DRAFT_813656 [Sparassis latifolia]